MMQASGWSSIAPQNLLLLEVQGNGNRRIKKMGHTITCTPRKSNEEKRGHKELCEKGTCVVVHAAVFFLCICVRVVCKGGDRGQGVQLLVFNRLYPLFASP
jgi:hypothetical protein